MRVQEKQTPSTHHSKMHRRPDQGAAARFTLHPFQTMRAFCTFGKSVPKGNLAGMNNRIRNNHGRTGAIYRLITTVFEWGILAVSALLRCGMSPAASQENGDF